jgi:hypothetical protein
VVRLILRDALPSPLHPRPCSRFCMPPGHEQLHVRRDCAAASQKAQPQPQRPLRHLCARAGPRAAGWLRSPCAQLLDMGRNSARLRTRSTCVCVCICVCMCVCVCAWCAWVQATRMGPLTCVWRPCPSPQEHKQKAQSQSSGESAVDLVSYVEFQVGYVTMFR